MMRLVGFLLGEKIENENKTKPFHANQNTVERKDWFLRTRPWHRVDPKITSALIEKFGDDPMFEAFVLLSMKQKLIDRYAALAKNEAIQGPELICSQIAAIVCMLGNSSLTAMGELMQASHFNEAKLSHHYGIVRDAFETTIILDNNQISAYLGLATAFAFLGKKEEGLKFAQQGLAKVKELKEQDVPFHLSSVVPDGGQMLDEMEVALGALIQEFS